MNATAVGTRNSTAYARFSLRIDSRLRRFPAGQDGRLGGHRARPARGVMTAALSAAIAIRARLRIEEQQVRWQEAHADLVPDGDALPLDAGPEAPVRDDDRRVFVRATTSVSVTRPIIPTGPCAGRR